MNELVEIPSEGSTLHGICHVPREPCHPRRGVVMFQGNLSPKFGAHRLFRQLADALAAVGIYALRYDSRGTCDSPGLCELDFAQRVTDGCSAVAFLRGRHRLEAVYAWGLCGGASVAVHSALDARRAEEKLDGLILCNLLADAAMVSIPEFDFQPVNLGALWRKLSSGGLSRKLVQAPRKLHLYRQNLPRLFGLVLRQYLDPELKLGPLRAAIGRVGSLLAAYEGPALLIFGEGDFYWEAFRKRVNPDDRLGLARKKVPAQLKIVRDADHTFAAAEQTEEMIRYSLEWLQSQRNGQEALAAPDGGNHGISAASTAH